MARGVGDAGAVEGARIRGDVILASASPGYYSAGGFLNYAGCDVSWMQVGCPRCPALVNVPVTMAGQMVVCPTCGLSYQVPGYAPPTAPPNAPLPPFPPPPQYGAPQYPAPQYAAPPAPAYVVPPPPTMPPPELKHPAPMPPSGSSVPPPAPPAPVAAQAAAAQPVAPASGLKPLEVLAPPSASLSAPGAAKSEPKRLRWQHEKRSQPEPARPPKAEESPTSMLPPATAKEFRAALAPANADEAAPAGGAAAKIPESAFPKSPDGGTALPGGPRVVGPARMDLSAVEERLAQQRRKTQTTIAVALFGLTAMTLFAWFVVNLSRPQ